MIQIQPLILAAGNGRRIAEYTKENFGEPIPKVMLTLNRRPLIDYILKTLAECQLAKPFIVVGFMKEKVSDFCQDRAAYIEQKERLGTGHAVMVCRDRLEARSENILILYGDMPFWSAETLKRLTKTHHQSGSVLTIGTVKFPDPNFWAYGRILRDKNNQIVGTVEQKDASEEEKGIEECWPGILVVQSQWLWPALEKINNQNAQKEYYLNSLVRIAALEGQTIASAEISDPSETLGINTAEQYLIALKNRHGSIHH